jgi:Spy/CpxP family protein refolding chaperone
MVWHRSAVLAVALVAGVVGQGRLLAGEKGEPKPKPPDPLDALAAKLDLDDKQKAEFHKLTADYDKKISPVRLLLWDTYHDEQLALTKLLADGQKARLPEVLKALRDRQLQTIAARLDLGDGPRQRIAKLCEAYEPKFRGLVAPKQQGQDVGKEEAAAIHKQIANLRTEFLAAVESELTPAQRGRLAAVLRGGPGLPAFVAEDAALAFVLLTAGLAHFSQPGYLDALADKLDLGGEQKKQFQKVAADFGPKIDKAGKELLELLQEQRTAMEKVLTDEQRAKWRQMRKAGGEDK